MARIDTLKNFLTDVADKLRECLGTTEKITHAEYDTKIDEVYQKGKTLEYDRFWDAYQDNGNRTQYEYAFAGAGWNDETLKPKYVPTVANGEMMFRDCYATYIPAVDVRNLSKVQSLFAYAQRAVTIEKVILKDDGSQTFTSNFLYCRVLKNITFEGVIGKSMGMGHSNLLTDESVQNIIDHLKDLTDADAQTLTLHATVGNKLTDSQINVIQSKNWNLSY